MEDLSYVYFKSVSPARALVSRLSKLAKETHRSEKFYIVEALRYYFEDYVDAQIAKDRFNDPHSRIISSGDLRKRLSV